MSKVHHINELILAAREGGNVERCHTVPHYGSYTNGKHSYDAVSLLLLLHPNPSVDLVKAVLWHDCAERFVGDAPAPAKWLNPLFGKEYERAEEEARRLSGLTLPKLTADEQAWVEAVDKAEFYLWAEDQRAMGNRHVEQAIVSSQNWFSENSWRLPEEVIKFLDGFFWRRLSNNLNERN